MGRVKIFTNHVPMSINVVIRSDEFRDLQVYVKHPNYPNTALTSRILPRFRGEKKIKFLLPITPENVEIVLRDAHTKDDFAPKIISYEKTHLDTRISAFNTKNKYLLEFINFARDFCLKASFLPVGKYNSTPLGNIKTDYVDKIITKNAETGLEITTTSVARVDGITRVIDVAQTYFKELTVSERFAILCHEFAHVFLNVNPTDEFEADKHAAMIYLGLGFPRVDLISAWYKVYKNANNKMNNQRHDKFMQYVKNFDNI